MVDHDTQEVEGEVDTQQRVRDETSSVARDSGVRCDREAVDDDGRRVQ
jgi:hypothetical protein